MQEADTFMEPNGQNEDEAAAILRAKWKNQQVEGSEPVVCEKDIRVIKTLLHGRLVCSIINPIIVKSRGSHRIAIAIAYILPGMPHVQFSETEEIYVEAAPELLSGELEVIWKLNKL
eukprot:1451027-Amphidinium_carterae.1